MTDTHQLTFRATPLDEARIEQVARALMSEGYDVYHNGRPSFQKVVKVLLFQAMKAQKPAGERKA